MSAELVYVQGDATQPTPLNAVGNLAIYGPHCCNDKGGWGSGYVVALTKRFGDSPSGVYKLWHKGANTETINARLKERNNASDVTLVHQTRFVLGGIQILRVPNQPITYNLVNMIGQHDYGASKPFMATRVVAGESMLPPSEGLVRTKSAIERPPIRYGAIAKAMFNLAEHIQSVQAEGIPCEIHCPKFGSELAGGDWKVIEQMILEYWVDSGISVCVYEWVK